GSLLRGDPDRARHDQADADSPADEPLGHLADPVQGEGATSVRLVLQILDERDQCLLVLRADGVVVEHRHSTGADDHRLVDVPRRGLVEFRSPATVGERTTGTRPTVAVCAVGQVQPHTGLDIAAADIGGVVLLVFGQRRLVLGVGAALSALRCVAGNVVRDARTATERALHVSREVRDLLVGVDLRPAGHLDVGVSGRHTAGTDVEVHGRGADALQAGPPGNGTARLFLRAAL